MEVDAIDRSSPFPWELGIFDAHCHPTDTMPSIDEIPSMKTRSLAIMATRGQDQHLVAEVASRFANLDSVSHSGPGETITNRKIIPCFGWHPWFSHQILDDTTDTVQSANIDKWKHYKSVLAPSIEDEHLLDDLPAPRPLSTFIRETRQYLLTYPYALVGEIGLDRSFRIPNAWFPHEIETRDPSRTPGSREGRTLSPYRVQLSHQKAILKAQLQLAGELQRPVSIHSVQAQGAVLEVLCELWKGYEKPVLSKRQQKRQDSATGTHDEEGEEKLDKSKHKARNRQPLPFPPRICMHSYSGPVEPLKQFLHPSNPADVYFSFSSVINLSNGPASKAVEVIKGVPDDRILAESDLHCAGQKMDDALEVIVRKICEIRGWGLEDGVKKLGANWTRFAYG
ncbi:Cut9-interacting protein scn1 [Emydomyces testavorans]|uniref:Cut9-interacting protein scn1 n=1 Tax=Emydomyces testavorans TaxID=2070801 RepID=A0AAF0IJZ6_9EURO|nr:Cut9-interacting protein scn1 [Emydomyces testavorans]